MSDEQSPQCRCAFPGALTSQDHRVFHREWERTVMGHGPSYTEATRVEVTDMLIRLDQQGTAIRELARALGVDVHLPPPTFGEQGWLTAHARKGQS